MAVTTVKVSTETRDRIRSFAGPTLEHTINEALDALEAADFQRRADRYAAWRRDLPEQQRRRLDDQDRELDAVVEALW